jgi:putative transposase
MFTETCSLNSSWEVTMSRAWFTAQELAGLPMLPGTVRNINRTAKRDHWKSRKRATGKGFEYHVSNLPEKTQNYLIAQAARSVVEADPAPAQEPGVPTAPAIEEMKDHKRERMEARAAVLTLIDQMTVELGSLGKAVKSFVAMANAGELPEETVNLIRVGKNRASKTGNLIHHSTLYHWMNARKKGLAALAPKSGRPPVFHIWEPLLLRAFQNPNQPHITEIMRDWDKLYPGEPGPNNARAAQRFLETVPNIIKFYGRLGSHAHRAVQPFVRRTFDMMWPMDCVTVDGHLFKAYVAHPYGRGRFRPEITNYLDIATRKCIGFSAWTAESQNAIWLAMREMVLNPECGVPAFHYSDNGAYRGEKHQQILARIGSSIMFSQPYRAQSRGVVERFNSSVWVPLARKFPTYAGDDNDQQAFKRALKRADKGGDLLSWNDFITVCREAIDEYNDRPHKSLRGRTPNEAWAEAIDEGWKPTPLHNDNLHNLMPCEWRTIQRGFVRLPWGIYFNEDLAYVPSADKKDGKVAVHYNPMDGETVIIANKHGQFVAEAKRDANTAAYIPASQLEHARQHREKTRVQRLESKIDTVHEQETPVLEAQPQDPIMVDLAQQGLERMQAEIEAQPAFVVPDNDPERYQLWRALDAQPQSTLNEEEKVFYERYRETNYCQNMLELEAEFLKNTQSG